MSMGFRFEHGTISPKGERFTSGSSRTFEGAAKSARPTQADREYAVRKGQPLWIGFVFDIVTGELTTFE